jgi:hypothetical protein
MMDDDFSDSDDPNDGLVDDETDDPEEHDDPDDGDGPDDGEDGDDDEGVDETAYAAGDFDETYDGYEPTVFDADATFDCAFCGETNGIDVDFTAGQTQSYVEDCQVCCRPNLLAIEFDDDGQADVVAEAEI